MKLLLCFLSLLFLCSCGHHRDGSSVWEVGLWIIPVALGIGSGVFMVGAYLSSRSGWQSDDAMGHHEGDENIPIHKTWQFYFSLVLLIAMAAVIYFVNREK